MVGIKILNEHHRQVVLLELIAGGYSNKQIARKIGLAERTTVNYVSELIDNLHANNRTHAVVIGLQQGIIKLGEVNK